VTPESLRLLRWARVAGAPTTELRAPSIIVGRTYTIARYDGGSRWYRWRLFASDEDETLSWARTLRAAQTTAQEFEDQRIADAVRTADERNAR